MIKLIQKLYLAAYFVLFMSVFSVLFILKDPWDMILSIAAILVIVIYWQTVDVPDKLIEFFYGRIRYLEDPDDTRIFYRYGTEAAWRFFQQWATTTVNWQERIQYVAVRHPTGIIFAVPRPYRHHHIFKGMDLIANVAGVNNTRDQGFLTDAGRYVTRQEALRIALKAKQLIRSTGNSNSSELFSEDLWETKNADVAQLKKKVVTR